MTDLIALRRQLELDGEEWQMLAETLYGPESPPPDPPAAAARPPVIWWPERRAA